MDKIKVLIVDDEPLARKVVRQKVPWPRFNMEVCGEATNGSEALAFLESHDVDVVFTDMKMPFVDGNDFIKKACKKAKHVKFVVLSAYSDFSLVRPAFKLGAFDYILKSDIDTPRMERLLDKLRDNIVHDEVETTESEWQISGNTQKTRSIEEQIRIHTGLITVFAVRNINVPSGEFANLEDEISRLVDDPCYAIKGEGSLTIIIHHRSSDEQNISNTKEKALSLLSDYSDSEIGNVWEIGVSETGTVSRVHDLSIQAQKACEWNYYNTEGSVGLYDHAYDTYNDKTLNTNEGKSKLFEYISHFDFQSVIAYFENLLKYFIKFRIVKDRVCDIVLDLYLYTLNHLYDIDLLPADFSNDINTVRRAICGMSKIYSLRHWIVENIQIIEHFFLEAYSRNPIPIIESYVIMNMEHELSLTELANSLGKSETYLSFLFSKKKGITLKHFITQKRIGRAKEYLSTTDLKVNEISQLIGYKNVEHFSRTFKKETGKSPGFYRKLTCK